LTPAKARRFSAASSPDFTVGAGLVPARFLAVGAGLVPARFLASHIGQDQPCPYNITQIVDVTVNNSSGASFFLSGDDFQEGTVQQQLKH